MGEQLGALLRARRLDAPVAVDLDLSLSGLAALCREVEINLLETLGLRELPPRLRPVDGRLT